MQLSAPIFRLKRQAKLISREARIPLSQALDRLAKKEGFKSWSLLAARASAHHPTREIFRQLQAGDLVLLAARPGHGKTTLSLELMAEAIRSGQRGVFFTFEYNETDIPALLQSIGETSETLNNRFEIDTSNAISSAYIMNRLQDAPSGTVAVIDYLQLLDQKRENPPLAEQMTALKSFAQDHGMIFVFISQVDRSFELSGKSLPTLSDVRLPNPLDMAMFNKTCFMNDGQVRFEAVA